MLKRKAETETSESSSRAKKQLTGEDIAKLKEIIQVQIDDEISYKKAELEKINERIFEGQAMLDKLRALIVCKYYSLNGKLKPDEYVNHPAIIALRRENIDFKQIESTTGLHRTSSENELANAANCTPAAPVSSKQYPIRICVGNVSKYLNQNRPQRMQQHLDSSSQSQYNNDLITHRWMTYVRAANCKNLENYVKKVVFYLHPSYKPYDIIEVKKAPFQVIKKGWGEFPIHVQIHFKDARNKRIDIIHQLKLDWTLTGLQTFGGESVIDAHAIINSFDFIEDKSLAENGIKEKKRRIDDVASEDEYMEPKTICHDEEQQQQEVETVQRDCNGVFQHVNTEATSNMAQEESDMIDDVEDMNFLKSKELEEFFNSSEFGAGCIDDLIDFCTNSSSFDLQSNQSNSNSCFDMLENGQQKSISEISNEKAAVKCNSAADMINQFIKDDSKPDIDESSISSTSSSNQTKSQKVINHTTPISAAPKPKSSIDDLLNLRPKTKPFQSTPKLSTITKPSNNNSSSPLSAVKPIATIQQDSTKSSILAKPKIDAPASNICLPVAKPPVKPTQVPVINKNENFFSSASKINKKCVIYKVESDDIPKETAHNKVTNPPITPIRSSSNLNGQQPLKNILENKTLVEQKQHQQQITKIKPKNENNATVINHHHLINDHNSCLLSKNSAKAQIKTEVSAQGKKSELKKEIVKQEAQIQIQASVAEVPIIAAVPQQQKLYTINDSLLSEVNKRYDFETYEDYLKVAQKYSPIVCKNASKHYLPFCAQTIAEFYAWPYAKRKANEWMRALNVKRKVSSMINKSVNKDKLQCWSVKKIVIWLRANGYTPLEFENMEIAHKIRGTLKKETQHKPNGHHYVSSLSPFDALIKRDLVRFDESYNGDIIDVTGEDHLDKKTVNGKACASSSSENLELNKNFDSLIELSNGGKYVKEQLDMLGLKSNPVNLSSNIGCKLTEEFLFSVCKHFCDDLIRNACSDQYQNSNISKRHVFPDELGVNDIYSTIKKNPKYDFLTNKFMADTMDTGLNENSVGENKSVATNKCNKGKNDVSQIKIK